MPFLKNASRHVNVEELSGSTAGIDVYCWLHKGAFGCAEKLVRGQKTDGYVLYVMRHIDLLLYHKIKPVLVFDGKNLPSKASTEKKRRENRQKYRKMAKDYLAAGKFKEASNCFQRCIDITPQMAREVISACRERNIDCIVAPYEADAQLAYLNKCGLIDLVISEDSDLTLFGCDKILFKLDSTGNGVLVETSRLNACLGQRADNFTMDKFRYMCIMSGCDYLPSLHGIGLGKALKFWGRVTNLDLRAVLPKIPSYLNMHQLVVTQEYIQGFIQAHQTFLYQIVFDPRERKSRPLNDYPDGLDANKLTFAGERLDDQVALQLALANIDLHTMERVGNFDPNNSGGPVDNPRYGKWSGYASIWSQDFIPGQQEDPKTVKRQSDVSAILKCFSAGPSSSDDNEVAKSRGGKRKVDQVTPGETTGQNDFDDTVEEVCVASTYMNNKKAKTEVSTIDDDDDDDERRTVYKSRFFKSSELTKIKAPGSDKKSQHSKPGDWLSQLDDSNTLEGQFVYTTHQEPTSAAKENKKSPVKVSTTSSYSTCAIRQAFKPVIANPCPKADHVAKRRNPFAKRSPPIKVDKEEKCGSQDLEPIQIDASQLSVCSIDSDSFGLSVASSLNTSPLKESPTEEEKSVRVDETRSAYFSGDTSSSNSMRKKPRAVSGLMKKGGRQINLLDLWGKKN